MPTREQLKELAELRLQEVETLISSGHYEGVVYLCGYVLELALKARICRLLRVTDYPDYGRLKTAFAVHDLEQLLLLSGLSSKLNKSEALVGSWSIAKEWRPDSRYTPQGRVSRSEALGFLDAIRHPVHGLLPWLRKHW